MRLPSLAFLLFLVPVTSFSQWTDIKELGRGGEPFVSTDGKGNVFATCHMPSELLVSRDFGASFSSPKIFEEGMCDLHVISQPDGRVNVVYIRNGVTGLQNYYSNDAGRTLQKGGLLEGPYDREWLATNPVNNELYVNWSDGYIGGPKSKGVFFAASMDNGKNWERRSRVDNEPSGSYAVDPYLTTDSEGRIYAMWATSADYNLIDKYRMSVSIDGGKTFTNHQTVGEAHHERGDCQERWMLGGIQAIGKHSVLAYYMDYDEVTVDGITTRPLLTHYRISTDGGVTFGPDKTVLTRAEIEESVRAVEKSRRPNQKSLIYIQTLPWVCTDGYGRTHMAFQDNRSGQSDLNGVPFSRWHVRLTTMDTVAKGFGESERVSNDIVCKRPPLDFLGCAADKTRVYVIWVETPNAVTDWEFTGNLMFGRKILKAPRT